MDAVGYSQRARLHLGLPQFKTYVNSIPGLIFNFKIPGVDQMIMRMPPGVAKPSPEAAVYTLNWFSATGTGILLAAIISAFVMGIPFERWRGCIGKPSRWSVTPSLP